MEHKTLSAELRKEFGKGPSRRYRSEGKIPAVVYGHENRSVTVDAREFSKKFKTISENTIITLSLGKENLEVLIKDYDENIVTSTIEHIDFLEVEKDKKVKTHVPVVLKGNAPGVKEGGVLVQKISEMEVECLPQNLPEQITVDISALQTGHSIHVKDIAAITGVIFIAGANDTVVVVNHSKSEAAPTEGAEAEASAE